MSWEYSEFALAYEGDWTNALNAHGALGWELVAVLHDEGSKDDADVRCVFKRRLNANGEPRKRVGRPPKAGGGRGAKTPRAARAVLDEPEEASQDDDE